MKVTTKNGFKISQSGIAKQLVINCHGGWVERDGYTEVPAGTTLMFYARHGDFTLGYKVVDAVREKPHEAKVGLKRVISNARRDEIHDKFYRAAERKKEELVRGLKLPEDRLDDLVDGDPATFEQRLATLAQEFKLPVYAVPDIRNNMNPAKNFQDAIQTELLNTCGLTDSFPGPQPMYNYSLSKEFDPERKKVCDRLFEQHRRGEVYDPDVDLLQIKTGNTRHLSDVFKAIERYRYTHVHFGACRVPYGETPSDVTL